MLFVSLSESETPFNLRGGFKHSGSMLLCTLLSDSLLFQGHYNKVYYVLTQRVVTLLQNYCFVSPKLEIFL